MPIGYSPADAPVGEDGAWLLMATHASEHPHAAPTTARTPGRISTLLRSSWVVEGAWTVAAMVLGLLIAAFVLHLWDARWHVPFNGEGDGSLNIVLGKDLIDNGWYFTNHALGAPLGQELYDYSAFDADNLQVLIIRILAFGTSDPAALINVYYVLGFAMVSGATYLTARALGFGRAVALLGSAVFTALPYHFERGAAHLFLGDYFAIPGACWLILMTLMGRPILEARAGVTGWRRWLSPRTVAVAVVCLVAGGSSLYYAVFTILFTGMAAILRAIVARSWRAGIPGILAAAAVGVVLLINIAPPLVYQSKHGKDAPVAVRTPAESELYATSLTQMLLPVRGHRIGAFARLTEKHATTTPVGGEIGQQIGLLLSVSFVGLLILAAVRALRGPPAVLGRHSALVGAAAIGGILTFLWATYGGFSALFSYVISPQVRAWTRLTPFICFFALVGLLAVVDHLCGRLTGRRPGPLGRVLAAGLLVVLGVLGVLDQTTKRYVPAYDAASAAWTTNARFVSTLERSVPKNSMILQLPFKAFPESGVLNGMQDYDLFQGYIHSRTLRWSYGAMKGRPEDWTDEAAQEPLPQVLKEAVAAGFAGVYIDRAGYADHGVATEATVRKTLGGAPPVVGDDSGRLVFYSALALRAQEQRTLSAAQRSAMAQALVHPVDVEYGDGFYDEEPGADGGPSSRWMGPDASVTFVNPGRQATGTFTATATAGVGTLTIDVPGQAARVVRFTRGPEKLRIPLTLPSDGKVTLTLHADVPHQGAAPDTRDLRVQLFGAQFTAEAS